MKYSISGNGKRSYSLREMTINRTNFGLFHSLFLCKTFGMRDLFLVGSGSFIGGVCRYYLGGFVLHSFVSQRFPISTLVVNLIGCFVIGVVGSLAEHYHMFSQSARLFIMTRLLGGFTTFSAFGYETFFLMRSQSIDLAIANIFLSVLLCLVGVWIGFRIVEMF